MKSKEPLLTISGLELKAAKDNGVMTAQVTLNNIKMDVLFDTGANTSIVGLDCLSEIINKNKDLKVDYADVPDLRVVGGGKVKPIGSVVLNVLVICRAINHKFYVVEGRRNIIGMDIMELLNVKMDTRRRTIKLGNGNNGKIMSFNVEKEVKSKIKIRIKEDVTLKSRSITCINVVTDDKDVSVLLLKPLQSVKEFCPRSLIKLRDGVSTLCLVNSTDRNYKLFARDIIGYGDTDYVYVDLVTEPDSGGNHFVDKVYREANNIQVNNNNSNKPTSITEELKSKIVNKINSNKYSSKSQKQQVIDLLMAYWDIFNDKLDKGGLVDQFPCNIKPVPYTQPIHIRRYNYSEPELKKMDTEVENLKQSEIIEDCISPWESPVVMIRKTDGSTRFCIDFRKLNKVIEKDVYPLPNIELVLRNFNQCKYFSKIDFTSGFFQIKLDENDRKYTAFSTRRGKFQFRVLPQGFANSSSIFQRTMNLIMSGLGWEYILVYVDDILVFSKSFEDHLVHLTNLFNKLREYKLTVKISKCEFAMKELVFLGHLIDNDGIRPDPKKTTVISKCAVPRNLGEVRTFLGVTGYYRKFIHGYSNHAKPLRDLTNGTKWWWTETEQKAFDKLKDELCHAPVLAHVDNTQPFTLLTDSSNYAVGVILEQNGHPVYYYSQSLKKAEQKYGTSEKECLAMVLGIKKFRSYLYGNPFTVITDHSCLRYLFENRDHVGRLMRWSLMLQEYAADMTIQYKEGRLHSAPDACSRHPIARSEKLNAWFDRNDIINVDKYQDDSESENETNYVDIHQINLLKGNRSDFIDTSRDKEYDDRMIEDRNESDKHIVKEKAIVEKLLNTKNINDSNDDVNWDEREYIDLNDFGKLQAQDPNAGLVIDYHLYGKLPVVNDEVTLKLSKECILEEGQLYKIEYKNGIARQCLWIPESKVEHIMEEFHGSFLGGHCGFDRTYNKINERYYFPLMYTKIKEFVQTCLECQRKKNINRKEYNALNPLKHPSYPFERMSMDLVGPLTETKNGNKYILTVMDYFSRWPEAIAIKDAEAITVGQAYLDLVLTRYGCPRIILTDRGSQFMSHMFDYINKVLLTRHRTSTPYHPQTNGVIEKFHYSLVQTMKYLTSTFENDWDDYINVSLFVFRTTRNNTIGMTPYEALYGFKASLPCDISLKIPKKCEDIAGYLDTIKDLRKEIVRTVENAHEKLLDKEDKKRGKLRFNFVKYDTVFIKNETVQAGKTRKFSNKYTGPYFVIEQTSTNNFTVRHAITGLKKRVHVSKIKRGYLKPDDYKEYLKAVKDFEKEEEKVEKSKKNKVKNREDKGKEKQDDSEDETNEGTTEKQWEVEEIIDHYDVKDEGRYYLIKWRDYTHKDNTWEHLNRLNCIETLEHYLSDKKNRLNRPFKKFKDRKEQLRWDRRGKDD